MHVLYILVVHNDNHHIIKVFYDHHIIDYNNFNFYYLGVNHHSYIIYFFLFFINVFLIKY